MATKGKIWSCKIGEHTINICYGPDQPMREAVSVAYEKITGHKPTFVFSGWGGELTEGERAVVENREPVMTTPPEAVAKYRHHLALLRDDCTYPAGCVGAVVLNGHRMEIIRDALAAILSANEVKK